MTLGLAEILSLVAVALAVISLTLLVSVFTRLSRLLRQQRLVLGSRGEKDIVSYATGLNDKLDNLRAAVEDLALRARDHEVRIDGCLSRVGLVRFDAYNDLGGRQSTSIALSDANENGVIITTVVSREFARIYVKTVRDGQPDVALAPEEIEALDQARSQAPFTVRPRPDAHRKPERLVPDRAPQETAIEDQLAPDQENRRRRHQGLPPLDELPPAPSTLGWPKLGPADLAGDEEPPAGLASTTALVEDDWDGEVSGSRHGSQTGSRP